MPRLDARGESVGYVGCSPDITEIYESQQALKETDRRKDEFLATLAHELRNPLAPLRNGLQVMKLARGNDEALEQARGMMERQLHILVSLVDDLLDVSRISRGQIAIHKQRIDIAAVIDSAFEISEPLLRQGGHEFTVTLPPRQVFVHADKVRLAQAVGNLLSNAAKYTEPGGKVSLIAELDGGDVLIKVKDTGIGIPTYMLTRIFDMFTQVDTSIERAQGGLGIGLTIVKRLVEMHGGTIVAHSAGHGMGSEFVVRLPAAVSATDEAQSEGEATTAVRAVQHRILVVDDNREAARTLSLMLQLMGNNTCNAYDGAEALQVAEYFKPDIILMDIGMPRLDGYQAARLVREQSWGKGVALVAVTGWGQDVDRKASQESGFDYHLVKPVEPRDLENLLGSFGPAAH